MLWSTSFRSSRLKAVSYTLLFSVLVLSILYWVKSPSTSSLPWTNDGVSTKQQPTASRTAVPFPDALLGTLYNESDFVNEKGIVPPFWSVMFENETELQTETDTRVSSWGPCYPLPNRHSIDWLAEIKRTVKTNKTRYNRNKSIPTKSVLGGCRPGFLIIGAGKCGTSSLYHYLTEHPRVLPAYAKQIHYFKYFSSKPLSWYYSWFPTTTSFLTSGALMTGEASPGYLPYPDVAHMVKRRMPGPKIVMIGRDPIDRSYSSYRYNYVTPTLTTLRRGTIDGVKGGMNDSAYEKHLFSFEQLVRAELDLLKECLAPGGYGEKETYNKWFKRGWAKRAMDRRTGLNLTQLIDLDEVCYGDKVDGALRRQWVDLQAEFPNKHILPRNLQLTQAILGRSLYLFPLEWWYVKFDSEDIYFVCTEELNDKTGEPMNKLGLHLGLPSYNFSDAISKGAYNVGGNRGYNKATAWEDVSNESDFEEDDGGSTGGYPLSEELYSELLDFFRPYNERLFALTGRRCDWEK